jgi:hypothetical protein
MKSIIESIQAVKDFDFKSASQQDIERILPTFGMNNEYLEEMPKEFESYYGWGIKFWQYPNQFSKFLTFLKDKEIDSYLEIGCRWGGTFIIINELLKRYNPYLNSHALDLIPPSEILDIYQNKFDNRKFFYHQIDSGSSFLFTTLGDESPYPNVQFDLVFIDGCHSYTCVKKDYYTALMMGAKYIVFHDIVNSATKGNKIAWEEIKRNHKNIHEFTDQYDSVTGSFLGIGVVEVSKEDSIFPMFSTHYHRHFDFDGRNGGN